MNDSKPSEKKQKSDSESTNNAKSQTDNSTPVTSKAKPKTNSNSNHLTISESVGDIFTATPNTLVIHACNCQGSWGGGIALAFKKNYPEAFKVYAKHCRDHDAKSLLRTALLIPPAELNGAGDVKGRVGAPRISGRAAAPKKTEAKHFIGCLFTSNFYGKRKDSPSKILDATAPAVMDLMEAVKDWNASHGDGEKVGEVRMCKINSGLFAVPWEQTVDVLEGIEVGEVKEIEVIEREE